MSYQVLARKWRPMKFAELSGQEHVVTALANSLTRGRLHHAYLLTGTRGVGKTTIARILAKSLNCVTGVSATPCGVCAACTAIDAGRFVDLLELDAASNTGIDNMREILDNARYAPTVGRYKVYLIDEVHMLSKAAFNSMLKTLEEPPEHVKFVLATTDPQKIPVTVLSRCLQFTLKPLTPALIGARIEHILEAEGVARDPAAVALIARAAHGSLRDGLSLLDQAIAFGGGEVREAVVRTMLGVVDRDYVYRIADALADADGPALLREADALAERGVDFDAALDELGALFHRIAVAQAVPAATSQFDDAERVDLYRARFSPELVQLVYQIALQGHADLAMTTDASTAFTMTLLRMLAFGPDAASAPSPRPERAAAASVATRQSVPATPAREVGGRADYPVAGRNLDNPVADEPGATERSRIALPEIVADWPAFIGRLNLSGMAAQLAAQTELKTIAGNVLTLALPAVHKHLADRQYADKLKRALEQATGRKLLLAFEVGIAAEGSLAASERRAQAEAHAKGEAAFRDEPFVRDLIAQFDGRVKAETIVPLGREPESK